MTSANGRRTETATDQDHTGGAATMIEISLPVAPVVDAAYVGNHIDVQLGRDEAIGLRMLFNGCHEKGIKLPNGKYINTTADAVRYMLGEVFAMASA